MKKNAYQKLARSLDQLPNGFPPTESGVELRLLEMLFEPQQAELASVMRLSQEPAEVIANRLDLDPRQASRELKDMVRKGLIRFNRQDRKLVYGLMPFVVGFYEEQLPRMDQELALVFEEYYQETQGGITREKTSVHRVIPVAEALDFEVEIFPHEQASRLIESAKAWGVRDCICRVQQRLIGNDCDHPVKNCLVFAPIEGFFDQSVVDQAISKQEALDILREAEQAGLVHTTGNYLGPHNYICNCCTCSCGILRSIADFNRPTAVASSPFLAVVDLEECLGCGDCLESCQFSALSLEAETLEIDPLRCVGCGLCALNCPTSALVLQRRPAEELDPIPENIKEWGQRRAEERGIDLDQIQ